MHTSIVSGAMEWFNWIGLLVVVYLLVQVVRLACGDADLSLLWKEAFGKKPGNDLYFLDESGEVKSALKKTYMTKRLMSPSL